jgi:hypothetical protein
MTIEEEEVRRLTDAVEELEDINKKNKRNSIEFNKLFGILHKFISSRKLLIYGGTAINELLPKEDQFYNINVDFPDYDVFSKNAMNDGKDLADIYYKAGFSNIELKSALHQGTYKLFVNYAAVCDITSLSETMFDKLYKEGIKRNNMKYAPINFLRMSIYGELSRPYGNITRWEKVLLRLNKLNKHYPFLDTDICSSKKVTIDKSSAEERKLNHELFETMIDIFVNEKCVFFGGYAFSLFTSKYPSAKHLQLEQPNFDVLHEEPERVAELIKDKIKQIYKITLTIEKYDKVDETVGKHYLLKWKSRILAILVFPVKCDSYNVIKHKNKEVRIATIDTILNYYLTFIYSAREYFNPNRVICMADFLFHLQQKNRTSGRGLLKRFAISCYGPRSTWEDLRAEKIKIFNSYKNNRSAEEFQINFLRYNPAEKQRRNVTTRKRRRLAPMKRIGTLKNKVSTFFRNIFK